MRDEDNAMPYVPAPNCVQAELFYNWNGQACETVLHYEATTAHTPTQCSDLAAALVTWWGGTWKGWFPTTLSLVGVKVTDLATAVSPVYDASSGLPILGTNGSPSLPNNVALAITKRTAARGRAYRGRIYLPGMVEVQVTDNAVSAAYITNFITGLGTIRNVSVTGQIFKMVVLSRYIGVAPRSEAIATDVTGFTTDGIIDSQRRRLPGRGA